MFRDLEGMLRRQKIIVEMVFDIQRKQHPEVISIAGPLKKSVASFSSSYHHFVASTSIGREALKYEMARNRALKKVVEVCATFINSLSDN